MKECVERMYDYIDLDFDQIMIGINKGDIKCGKYSHLVKINDKIMKGKEFFKDGNDGKSER